MKPNLILLLFLLPSVHLAFGDDDYLWTSKTGHQTKAKFLKLDEVAGTVTLLVPRTLDLDDLDKSSIELARKLAAEATQRRNELRAKLNALSPQLPVVPVLPSEPQTKSSNDENLAGQVRYIRGFVWGVGDFGWYDPLLVLPSDPDEIRKLKDKYGVKKLPNKSRVTVIKRRRHPVSNNWTYHVKHATGEFWVLEGDLSAKPPSGLQP